MSVAVLADTPFVYPPRSAGPRAFEKPLILCEEHGFRPRIAHEASHWLTILRLVGAGLGVSIAPACVRHIATPEVACVPLQETTVVSDLELLHRAGEHRPMVHALGRIATHAGYGNRSTDRRARIEHRPHACCFVGNPATGPRLLLPAKGSHLDEVGLSQRIDHRTPRQWSSSLITPVIGPDAGKGRPRLGVRRPRFCEHRLGGR